MHEVALGEETPPEKIFRWKSTNQEAFVPLTGLICAFRSEHFLRWCLPPERNRAHNLFFLFPIAFGIIFFLCEALTSHRVHVDEEGCSQTTLQLLIQRRAWFDNTKHERGQSSAAARRWESGWVDKAVTRALMSAVYGSSPDFSRSFWQRWASLWWFLVFFFIFISIFGFLSWKSKFLFHFLFCCVQ